MYKLILICCIKIKIAHASIESPLVCIYWSISSKSRISGVTYQDFKQSVACIDLYLRLLRQGVATFLAFENWASDGVELAQTEKIFWAIFAKTENHIAWLHTPLALGSLVVPRLTDLHLQSYHYRVSCDSPITSTVFVYSMVSLCLLQVESGAFTHFGCGDAACFPVHNWRILYTQMKT